MNLSKDSELIPPADENSSGMSRRSFFKRAAAVGTTSAFAFSGLTSLAAASDKGADADHKDDHDSDDLKKRDRDILVAAQIAEALAVTTYSNIINIAPFFTRLESDDQGYLIAARQEEMSHYLLEESVVDQFTPF